MRKTNSNFIGILGTLRHPNFRRSWVEVTEDKQLLFLFEKRFKANLAHVEIMEKVSFTLRINTKEKLKNTFSIKVIKNSQFEPFDKEKEKIFFQEQALELLQSNETQAIFHEN